MMTAVNGSMQTIVDRSSEMRGIVAMIDSVAFQTNILALNAAIEAAHAGERGADLRWSPGKWGCARKSSHSTQTIQALINHSLQGIEEGSSGGKPSGREFATGHRAGGESEQLAK
ncbi:methyl-accepting chemotaxis protein [Enterobacter hormaechei]